ncbi:hypothetical protein ISN44_As08g003180 [Arabidopsis suecica]|uniref:Uncharacterized protein n=1 Tax=Arabidopsis suecica TaxID=45249 RepID=A0A8T2B0X0_ARASU|nr:hypothetical protein ISN44_As08g003180 [Arabidopsis suecica]
MPLQNLTPSISNLSPISIWVSFHDIKISSSCVGEVVSGEDGVSDRACCDQVPPQSRASFLSFHESVSPTLSWPQPKCYGVGFFPSSNGVRRFFTGTSLFHYKRVCGSHMNLSDSGIRNQFSIWDPGVIDCDSIVSVMKFDHNRNASVRYIVESRDKMGMGTCVNKRIRHGFRTIRSQKSDFFNKNHSVEIQVKRVTAARASESCVKNLHTSWYCPDEDIPLCQICNAPFHLNKRMARRHERVQNPFSLMLGGEDDDGYVLLFFSNVNGLHQYWPIPLLQLVIFSNFNTFGNTNVLFGLKVSVRTCHICDDDVDRVVGSNTSQVVFLTEVTNLLLCQKSLWFSPVRFKDLLESGKATSSKDATVETTIRVNLFVKILKKITKSNFLRKTLVRKLWYHRVYNSELFMDTSGLKLRFAKRKFSHKLLHANRNKEKSNMKLDNNGSYGRLASKTTLRKASSISLLLYFS